MICIFVLFLIDEVIVLMFFFIYLIDFNFEWFMCEYDGVSVFWILFIDKESIVMILINILFWYVVMSILFIGFIVCGD